MYKHSIVLVLLVASCLFVQAAEKLKELNFRKDGTFKIVQFTDIHWENDMPANQLTLLTMGTLLDREQPDLVVLTGDIVTSSDPELGWPQVVAPMVDRQINWVATLGNHDSEGNTSRHEVHQILSALPFNLNQSAADVAGEGNFSLPVKSTAGNKDGAVLYFFDSHAYAGTNMPGHYDWVKINQIEWYKQQSDQYREANRNYPVPSYAFLHIPLPEYKFVARDPETVGHKDEGVSSPEINTGLFAALVQQQDVIGLFCGHDHDNDFIGSYLDVALAYGRCTGTYAYGELRNGARVIELHEEEFRFNSWIATPRRNDDYYSYPEAQNNAADADQLVPACDISRKELQPGIAYRYFEGKAEKVSDIEQLTPVKSGVVANISLDEAQQEDHFAFIFDGYIEIPETGTYQFYLLSDDGSTLELDDHLLIDNDGGHSDRLKKSIAKLEKGFHRIRLRYFEDYMGQALELGVSSLKMREGMLSRDMLFNKK